MNTHHPVATVAACCAVSTALGSIHAFSVFIPAWEQLPGADRAGVSLIYSVALVSLTSAVLFGYRIYTRLTPSALICSVGLVAAMGLWASAQVKTLTSLTVSYGVVFGLANGIGYGFALQLAGQVEAVRRGLAIGLVTAFYAVGASVSPFLFTHLIVKGGNALALIAAALVVGAVALVAALVVAWSGARFRGERAADLQPLSHALVRARRVLWLAYGSAALAGLMVIGHAFSLAVWMGMDTQSATWATTVVALGNMLGGFSAGYLSGRVRSRVLLVALPVLTAAGLLGLMSPLAAVYLALSSVGFAYGALIAIYPIAVSELFGSLSAPRLYGQIFTAWGCAGLLGPWASGWLYDHTESYGLPLLIATGLSIASALIVWSGLPRDTAR